MTQLSAGERKLLGLGRYRFGEVLSTSFFGPRYKVAVDPTNRLSEPPVRFTDHPPARLSELPGDRPRSARDRELAEPLRRDDASSPANDNEAFQQSSLRPRADLPLALRLVEADAPSLIELLARSVQAVRDLDHRAILRPLQIVRSSTRLGVVTPHIEGLTLAQLLEDVSMRQASIPPAVVLRIASDVLEGLEAMRVHATGARRQDWVFGGLTPDSIHVGVDGQTRLLDPGLAGSAARQPCWAHEAAALAYTAPEQTGADATFDASSDNFSLGVILWELLTGRPLFGAATAAQTLESLHRSPIPRVQRHHFVRGEPIAFSLAQAVAQALRRKPAQRFSNYEAFATALTQSGEVATPADVGDLVTQALSHESVDELKARLARVRSEAPSIATLPRTDRPPEAEPAAPAVPIQLQPRMPSPLSIAAVAQRRISATPTQTPSTLADELPAGVRTLRRPSSLLPSHLVHKLSAFPIGDLLLRRGGQRKALRAVLPLALAAVALLGLGTYLLQPSPERSSTSGAAPAPPPPAAEPVRPAPEQTSKAFTNHAHTEVNTDPAPSEPRSTPELAQPHETATALRTTPLQRPDTEEQAPDAAGANPRTPPPAAASVRERPAAVEEEVRPRNVREESRPPVQRAAPPSASSSAKRKRAAPSVPEKPLLQVTPLKPPPRPAAPAPSQQQKFIPDDI